MKEIHINMPDGSVWRVPVEVIAKHKAESMTDLACDSMGVGGDYWRVMLRNAMNDNDEAIIYWATQNMNWADVEPHAKIVLPKNNVNYQQGWMSGKKEVIDCGN